MLHYRFPKMNECMGLWFTWPDDKDKSRTILPAWSGLCYTCSGLCTAPDSTIPAPDSATAPNSAIPAPDSVLLRTYSEISWSDISLG